MLDLQKETCFPQTTFKGLAHTPHKGVFASKSIFYFLLSQETGKLNTLLHSISDIYMSGVITYICTLQHAKVIPLLYPITLSQQF